MIGYIGITAGISMVFGLFITGIMILLFKDMYGVYKDFHPIELRTTLYSFASFLFAALSLGILNIVSVLLSMDYFYSTTEIPLFVHELSFIIYNIYLAIGLGLFIYSGRNREETAEYGDIAAALAGVGSVMMGLIKIFSIITGLEAFILLYFYTVKKKGIGRLFSGKLWTGALLLIFIGRVINVLDLIPLSYLSILYFDLFAFTSLLILQLEARMELRE
jgi:hypothetical protein